MSNIREGTAQGLIEFVDYMSTKGLMKQNTAASYRAAASKVFDIDGDGWETTDVRQLDVDRQLERFETLAGTNYTPGSLATYKTRFRRGVQMYLDYLESPSSFKPRHQSRRRRTTGPTNSTDQAQSHPEKSPIAVSQPQLGELIEYPFPLTTGETAYLRLPRNVSPSDVDRLSAFLRSIAMDLNLEAPKGRE